jgi:soluble lytic murein transglycosylase-like protein
MTLSTDTRHTRGTRLERYVLRGGLLLLAALLMSALGGWTRTVRATDTATGAEPDVAVANELLPVEDQLEAARGELALVKLQLDRAQAILNYARRYRIDADLSQAIYDIAVSEGIDPAVGYRLVQVESNFKADAVSSQAALGYTQIQLPTARIFQPKITEAQLMRRDANLRLGFRYLKRMLDAYDHDLRLALLAYNRGPVKVDQVIAAGGDPGNGYAQKVLKGYRTPADSRASTVR